MKFLRNFLDKQAPHFEKGGSLENLYPFYEANDTLLFTPGEVTKGNVHVRDALDLKRMMITVVVALLPCVFMAVYNTGYQANYWISQGATPLHNWQEAVYFSIFGSYEMSFISNFVHGLVYFLPIFAMTFLVGGHIEVAFALARKHEINEGFLVTGFLFPLTLPPTIPLWQVAIGITFGVIIGKEVFGGTGMNVLNVALTARAFLFFAYPADISGDSPWIAADLATVADGTSGATMLAMGAAGSVDFSSAANAIGGLAWSDAFFGFIPGSMGETSTIACLIGAFILIVTQIGSWRTMASLALGTAVMSMVLSGDTSTTSLIILAVLTFVVLVGSGKDLVPAWNIGLTVALLVGGIALTLQIYGTGENPMYKMPFYWHVVVGGWAFGMVFMATDPVTSAFTEGGKILYGFLIGVLVVLVRVVNPAYPEGMMLAILFMNMFAPFIDHFFVQANIKRRLARHGA